MADHPGIQWFELTAIIGICTFLFTILGAGVGWLVRLHWRAMAEIEKVREDADRSLSLLHKKHEDLRVKVAEEYVTARELDKAIDRVEQAVKGLSQRVESGFRDVLQFMQAAVRGSAN